MDEDLVTELIELERRIAADEYTITLARAASGNDVNRVTLEEDLKRRIAETASRMDYLRVRLAETPGPPAASRTARPKRARSTKRSSPTETGSKTPKPATLESEEFRATGPDTNELLTARTRRRAPGRAGN